MRPLSLAGDATVKRRKAAAGLPQSKKGRSELRHYRELLRARFLNYRDMHLSWRGYDPSEGV